MMPMDQMERLMTPNMIKAASDMMSQMDPNALNSMMSLAAKMAPPDMAPPPGFDATLAQRAAAEMKNLSNEQLELLRKEALSKHTQVRARRVQSLSWFRTEVERLPVRAHGGPFPAEHTQRDR